MVLPDCDIQYLQDRGLSHVETPEGGMTCLVLNAFPLSDGFDKDSADLLIRLPAAYPDVPPDMWWFDPPVRLSDSRPIPATESMEPYIGRTWQRWSRHFPPTSWHSGIDGLESFVALIVHELDQAVRGAV